MSSQLGCHKAGVGHSHDPWNQSVAPQKKKDLWQITMKPVDLSPVPVDVGLSPVFLSHYGWFMDSALVKSLKPRWRLRFIFVTEPQSPAVQATAQPLLFLINGPIYGNKNKIKGHFVLRGQAGKHPRGPRHQTRRN